MDLLAMAATKRHLSTANAIADLVKSWNLVSARALLRVQIDTVLRFSGAWLVRSQDEFARQVTKGTRIDKIKDRTGQPLTDRYLVERNTQKFSWLPETYRRLSGFVHFSDAHIFATVTALTDDGFHFELSATDDHYPESSWVEILECFLEVSDFLLDMLRDWIERKSAVARPPGALPQT